MCVYYTHTHTYTYIHMHIYTYYTCTHIHIFHTTGGLFDVDTWTSSYEAALTSTCMYVCAYITHTHTYTHIYIYIYIHIHILHATGGLFDVDTWTSSYEAALCGIWDSTVQATAGKFGMNIVVAR